MVYSNDGSICKSFDLPRLMYYEFKSKRLCFYFQEKKVNEDSVQKLTPIVVTGNKIISLKKKTATATDGPSEQSVKPKTIALTRKMQTATVSENETGGQAKPALRPTIISKKIRIDDEEFDEEELLADSPPPPSATVDVSLKSRTNAVGKVGDIPTTMFSNRRVVVRNVDTNIENNLTNKAATGSGGSKGIFDRLDKKVIGVNESAKRKIQRIVINNTE